uniref:F-box domain-containing protein n=1 Tax=Amphimedon queenslandica TaxID=400682 RepID=A0A1X7TL94_AMPQE
MVTCTYDNLNMEIDRYENWSSKCMRIKLNLMHNAVEEKYGSIPYQHSTERIFIYTSFKDLIRCSMVCKKWYSLLSDEDSIIWRANFEDAGTRHFRNSKHLSELQTFRSKALAYECAWNGQDASKNIYIKDDCLTLHRKPVAQSSDGIRGKTGFLRGQHYFVVIFQ